MKFILVVKQTGKGRPYDDPSQAVANKGDSLEGAWREKLEDVIFYLSSQPIPHL